MIKTFQTGSTIPDSSLHGGQGTIEASAEEGAGAASADLPTSPMVVGQGETDTVINNGDGEPVRGEMKALGVFSRIWYVAVDEATFLKKLEAQEEGIEDDVELPQPPTQAELTVAVSSFKFQLGGSTRGAAVGSGGLLALPFLEAELQGTQIRTASLDRTMQEFELQMQSAAIRHNIASVEMVSRLLIGSTASAEALLLTGVHTEEGSQISIEEPSWDEVFGIHAWQVPLRSTGRLRSAANALEMQKSTSGIFSEVPCCLIHAGQLWLSVSPSLQEHMSLFLSNPRVPRRALRARQGSRRYLRRRRHGKTEGLNSCHASVVFRSAPSGSLRSALV